MNTIPHNPTIEQSIKQSVVDINSYPFHPGLTFPLTENFILRGHTIKLPYSHNSQNYFNFAIMFAILEVGGMIALKSLQDNKILLDDDTTKQIEAILTTEVPNGFVTATINLCKTMQMCE